MKVKTIFTVPKLVVELSVAEAEAIQNGMSELYTLRTGHKCWAFPNNETARLTHALTSFLNDRLDDHGTHTRS